MKSRAGLTLCIGLLAVVPLLVRAQWPPEELVNLQVLPQDLTVPEIRDLMRGFAGGLGVQCDYCHVGEDPNDLNSFDFAADDKIQKHKARAMIRMVESINIELLAAVPGRSDPPVEVTCRTCHHSLTRPSDIRDVLEEKVRAEGVDATIALYEELREKYHGSDAYDFRHFMLANVAERFGRDDPEGAIKLLEFNGKLHPASGQTFFTMAQIYRGLNDTEGNIRSLERAVAAEPSNEFYRNILQRVKRQQATKEKAPD